MNEFYPDLVRAVIALRQQAGRDFKQIELGASG